MAIVNVNFDNALGDGRDDLTLIITVVNSHGGSYQQFRGMPTEVKLVDGEASLEMVAGSYRADVRIGRRKIIPIGEFVVGQDTQETDLMTLCGFAGVDTLASFKELYESVLSERDALYQSIKLALEEKGISTDGYEFSDFADLILLINSSTGEVVEVVYFSAANGDYLAAANGDVLVV